jgi:hypothetical protein
MKVLSYTMNDTPRERFSSQRAIDHADENQSAVEKAHGESARRSGKRGKGHRPVFWRCV